ncbi:MAG: hypothetical protein IE931_13470 [Sphingobacteriales bacterium]|nr:hypothetical protein [Sphingobacteriales bacterium]
MKLGKRWSIKKCLSDEYHLDEQIYYFVVQLTVTLNGQTKKADPILNQPFLAGKSYVVASSE